jgi:hypothetical protein
MIYHDENEIRQRMRIMKVSLKTAASALRLRPGTLSAKLTGWSYLLPEERRTLLEFLKRIENASILDQTGLEKGEKS